MSLSLSLSLFEMLSRPLLCSLSTLLLLLLPVPCLVLCPILTLAHAGPTATHLTTSTERTRTTTRSTGESFFFDAGFFAVFFLLFFARGMPFSKSARAARDAPFCAVFPCEPFTERKQPVFRARSMCFGGARTSGWLEGCYNLVMVLFLFSSSSFRLDRFNERSRSPRPCSKPKKPNSKPQNDKKNNDSDTSRVVLRVLTARSVQRVLAQVRRKLDKERKEEKK